MCYVLVRAALVRRDGFLSAEVTLQCGVREGRVLSPVLFALYVNSIILELLNKSGYGCHIGSMFVGCVMYAGYLLLLSASLYDLLQRSCQLNMVFNASKSQVIRV